MGALRLRSPALALWLAAFAGGAALAAAGTAPPQTSNAEQAPYAARALDSTLSWKEFDALAVDRHAMSETGRAALKHLLRARLLDRLARESRLEVAPEEVERRWQEIDREVAASGESTGLTAYLREQRIQPDTFREFLRLAIVQETLARRALGIPAPRPVSGEQQEMWLDQVVEQREAQFPPAPWKDGIAARCGDLEIRADDFVRHLRTQLTPEEVREDCHQLLLQARMRARMPDLAADALRAAVAAELNRRAEIAADPKYQGLSYEQIAGAQGVLAEAVERDPAVVAAALAHVWVDRTHGGNGLRAVYEKERAQFDARFGDAVEAHVLFLRAAVMTNDLNPRSFEDAERELARLAKEVHAAPDFARLCEKRSEDPGTRESGGRLGWVTRGDERVPEEIRRAAFPRDSELPGDGQAELPSGLVGPVRLSSGMALVWLGARRPAPGWEQMSAHVHRELRRRFMDEVCPEKSVTTFLDEEPRER